MRPRGWGLAGLAIGLLLGCEAPPGPGLGPAPRFLAWGVVPEGPSLAGPFVGPSFAAPGLVGPASDAGPSPQPLESPVVIPLQPSGGGGGGGGPTAVASQFPAGQGGVGVALAPLLAALEGGAYRLLAVQVARLDFALLQSGRPDRKQRVEGAALRSGGQLFFDGVWAGPVRLRVEASDDQGRFLSSLQATGEVRAGEHLVLAPQAQASPLAPQPSASGNADLGLGLGFDESPPPAGALLNAWALPRVEALGALGEEGAIVAKGQVVEGAPAAAYELWDAAGFHQALLLDTSGGPRPMAARGAQAFYAPSVKAHPSLPALNLQASHLALDADGRLALLVPGSGALRVRQPNGQVADAGATGSAVAPATGGHWWLAQGQGLRRSGQQGPNTALGFAPTQLCEDGQGGVWALDGATEVARHLDAQGQPLGQADGVKALAASPDGQVWALGASLRRLAPDGSALASFPYAGDRLAVGSHRIWAHGGGVLRLIAR